MILAQASFFQYVFCDVLCPTFKKTSYPTVKARNANGIIQFLLKNNILQVTTTIDIPTPEDIIDQSLSGVGLS